jgi:predicted nucleic-acid-binding Zn-ribbon protein
MKRTSKCPKCGSSDIIVDAKVIDRAHLNIEAELTVATFRKPEAALFKGQLNTTLSAWVCAGCGFVEFYADSPKSIKVATD